MNCWQCGNPYRHYSPWYEPPENHYYKCDPCGQIYYRHDPEEEPL